LTVRDEWSRYILGSERMRDAKTETVWESFERLFGRYGVPGSIRSDNGVPFASVSGVLGLSRLSSRWVALGIDLERGRPGCPQDNGGHERMHRDLSKEVEQARGASTQAELDVWREEFNEVRPHESLGMKSPGQVYTKSAKRYEGLPEALDYGGMETRRIMRRGQLTWEGRSIFISAALAGWEVGLKPCGPGRWEVYFAQLRLGELEPHTESFIVTQWGAKETLEEPAKLIP